MVMFVAYARLLRQNNFEHYSVYLSLSFYRYIETHILFSTCCLSLQTEIGSTHMVLNSWKSKCGKFWNFSHIFKFCKGPPLIKIHFALLEMRESPAECGIVGNYGPMKTEVSIKNLLRMFEAHFRKKHKKVEPRWKNSPFL